MMSAPCPQEVKRSAQNGPCRKTFELEYPEIFIKLWFSSGIIVALRLQYWYRNTLVNCLVGMDKSFINFQPKQILLLGSPYQFSNFASGKTVFWKIPHWNGAGIDRKAAVRESFPDFATLCSQTGLKRTSSSSLLQALVCEVREWLPYGRLAVDPRTISVLNIFSSEKEKQKMWTQTTDISNLK